MFSLYFRNGWSHVLLQIFLQDLRKDLQHNLNNVDLDKYRLPENLSDSEANERLSVRNVSSRIKAPQSKRARKLDCLCAKEGQLNDHDLDPKEYVYLHISKIKVVKKETKLSIIKWNDHR